MPLYFFHIRHPDSLASDEEGQLFEDFETASAEAHESARDIAVDYIRSGRSLDGHSIEMADENGTHRLSIPLAAVIK